MPGTQIEPPSVVNSYTAKPCLSYCVLPLLLLVQHWQCGSPSPWSFGLPSFFTGELWSAHAGDCGKVLEDYKHNLNGIT